MVTRWKWYKYVLIHFKMQSNMNSNTSDIAQKKVMCWIL